MAAARRSRGAGVGSGAAAASLRVMRSRSASVSGCRPASSGGFADLIDQRVFDARWAAGVARSHGASARRSGVVNASRSARRGDSAVPNAKGLRVLLPECDFYDQMLVCRHRQCLPRPAEIWPI